MSPIFRKSKSGLVKKRDLQKHKYGLKADIWVIPVTVKPSAVLLVV